MTIIFQLVAIPPSLVGKTSKLLLCHANLPRRGMLVVIQESLNLTENLSQSFSSHKL